MKRVVIVGGGLAGLAAAVQLADRGLDVKLFESRRELGGRAGSFVDPETDERVDHCQHVGMGCCTRLLALSQLVGQSEFFRRDTELRFVGPDGTARRFAALPLLPAPWHLSAAMLRMNYLSWRDRFAIATTMRRLARLSAADSLDEVSFGEWLRRQGASDDARRMFWSVIVVSALSESLDLCSLAVARKVFVDGFLTGRESYHVLVPTGPLGEWSQRIAEWLESRGVTVHRGVEVERLEGDRQGVQRVELSADAAARSGLDSSWTVDAAILAVPWHGASRLLGPTLRAELPELDAAREFPAAAISSLHLWWDRDWFRWPHAVLVDRRSQWVFRHAWHVPNEHYLQVVMSATHGQARELPETTCEAVVSELREVFPTARESRVLRWRLLVQPRAVFSPRPGLERLRPTQRTNVPRLYVAGDWTRTGWPATMEGAIRGGELAATALLRDAALQPDSPESVT